MDSKKLDIYQLNGGYFYNSDSLFLYGFARNFLKNNIKLLDIGAGSGILGLLCARDFSLHLTLNEINPAMIEICAMNASNNAINAEIVCGDILDSNISGFDVIISNPPFYRRDVIDSKNAHLYLAKKSENLPIDSLCKWVKNAINPNGKFIFCYDAKEIKNVFIAINEVKMNIEVVRFVHPREHKNASLAMFVCGISKSQTKIFPPLYNFIGDTHSSEAQEIFSFCNTCSYKIDDIKKR